MKNTKKTLTERAKLAELNKTLEVIRSGYAGVMPNGNIVDRREHSDAMPIQKNPLFGTPEPKHIKNKQ